MLRLVGRRLLTTLPRVWLGDASTRTTHDTRRRVAVSYRPSIALADAAALLYQRSGKLPSHNLTARRARQRNLGAISIGAADQVLRQNRDASIVGECTSRKGHNYQSERQWAQCADVIFKKLHGVELQGRGFRQKRPSMCAWPIRVK